jgi:hypothetical protein
MIHKINKKLKQKTQKKRAGSKPRGKRTLTRGGSSKKNKNMGDCYNCRRGDHCGNCDCC